MAPLPLHNDSPEGDEPTDRLTDQNTNRRSRPLTELQKHLIPASGEFFGSLLFLHFAYSCQIMLRTENNNLSSNGSFSNALVSINTSLAYGFSLLVNVWAFYRISGGLFNPAVTFGMVLAGALSPIRGLIYFIVQLLASMCAAGLVSVMFPGDIGLTNTTLSSNPKTTIAQGVFIEMFMTAELMFVILMLSAEKSKTLFLGPLGIGLALFAAMLGGQFYTGGSLNPARSFGPAVVSHDFPGYHWIYWVGPFLGAGLAAGYYRFVKYFKYEEASPGQVTAAGGFAVNVLPRI
ncbi:hypothetical protein E8E13_000631 [Curvularia kusanoi]|uniref:Aquaporin n=1 Tax=Curvularia kusanoi TaxID=90978 RepID=A0A9P4T2R6_CURKU|nr:hypothetical protein E8E13_000631 [Curvularia kusanoi]